MNAPQVIVIAGPNGAGKSTVAPVLLHDLFGVDQYVNADTIAAGLAGYNPNSVALEAGRLMLRRLRALAEKRESFAFETTLASRSFAPWLQKLRERGYIVQLVFLWLASPDQAIGRVADRVALGGHNIEEHVIRRRYDGGLSNLRELYWSVAHQIMIFDTSTGAPQMVAMRDESGTLDVRQPVVWQQISGAWND